MPSRRPTIAVAAWFACITVVGSPLRVASAESEAGARNKSVQVLDQAGQPVVGARVVAWAIRTERAHGSWGPKGFGQSEPPERTTDAEGRVSISCPKFADRDHHELVKAVTCRVSHPDFVESVYNDVPAADADLAKEATITLGPGDLIEVAGFSGADPLPIDRVYAQWSSDSYSGHEGTSITDDGLRRLPRLPPGPELLRLVYLPDEGDPLFSVVDPLMLTAGKRRRLRVMLEPGTRVSGRLDDSVPRPVVGGHVVGQVIDRLEPEGENGPREALTWRTSATINADGTFELPPMPAGDLQLIAMCDGFLAQSGDPPAFVPERQRNNVGRSFGYPQVFTIARGDNPQITLAMTPAASCEFEVSDPEGRPLPGVRVSFWPNVQWWAGGSQIYCWPSLGTTDYFKTPADVRQTAYGDNPFAAETDAAGKAVIKTLPAGLGPFVAGNDQWELWADESHGYSGNADLKAGEHTTVKLSMQPRKEPQ